MGLLDGIRAFVEMTAPRQEIQERESVEDLIGRIQTLRDRPWRISSIREAMGVPAIQRAVSLIASTTGMLTVQGVRNGSPMPETPRLLARPNPYETPYTFYSTTAYCMASRGEFVWWIAKFDADGPTALVNVPLNELNVSENSRNRLLPTYEWGDKRGTRYSGANPDGRFVHHKYPLAEPFALRGSGPLQICGAATSVTVEAQEWAANFYADGGRGGTTIKSASELGAELDADGLSEADRLRAQWVAKGNNLVRVIDPGIESVTENLPNEAGAQMLESRQHQNGDAARMFGIPGSLIEYQQPGASLTYQNLEGEFTKFVKTCLQPLYLEPIEQALSDLLSRSTVARFNVDGFTRPDAKTRADIYNVLVPLGVMSVEQAQAKEGIIPGDIEFAPVPFSPPQAIPAAIEQRSEMRDFRHTCGHLLGRISGPAELFCRHCKVTVAAA